MRKATVELDKTQGTVFPPDQLSHDGKTWSIKSIYEGAGYDLKVVRSDEELALPATGKHFDLPTLHEYMTKHRQPGAGWHAHVMIVPSIRFIEGSRFVKPLGIMYDFRSADLNSTPREGCAVNYDLVSQFGEAAYLRTVAHEIGHVFNLFHPKAEQPPRPIGTTVMNQTGDLQRLGNFPDNISFEFSDENKLFLKTAAPDFVRPGGKSFGTRPPQGSQLVSDQGYKLTAGLELALQLDADEVLLGEPVMLTATLTNTGDTPLFLSPRLTPNAGDLTVTIDDPLNRRTEFRPVYVECTDHGVGALKPGQTWTRTFPIFYGAAGHTFGSGGTYRVTATYQSAIEEHQNVAVARPVEVLVREPGAGLLDLSDLMMDDNTALFMVLSGGRHLTGATARLTQIVDRARRSNVSEVQRIGDLPRVALAVDRMRPGVSDAGVVFAQQMLEPSVAQQTSASVDAMRSRVLGLAEQRLGNGDAVGLAYEAFNRASIHLGDIGTPSGSAEWVQDTANQMLPED